MLHAVHNGYFLVDKDSDCKDCGGDGLNKSKDASRVASEIPYCETCVHPELRHFGQIWEEKLAEQEQSAHAEVVDKKLEKRLFDARARVAELIASKDTALAQNDRSCKRLIKMYGLHASVKVLGPGYYSVANGMAEIRVIR